jgi:hypothetical protein
MNAFTIQMTMAEKIKQRMEVRRRKQTVSRAMGKEVVLC